jgi:hypothetical protein
VLAGGMWLVRGGAPATPGPRGQGFRDPSLFRPNPRVAVGITARGKLLLAVTRRPVSLERWARALGPSGPCTPSTWTAARRPRCSSAAAP